jgi:hypothetical protein
MTKYTALDIQRPNAHLLDYRMEGGITNFLVLWEDSWVDEHDIDRTLMRMGRYGLRMVAYATELRISNNYFCTLSI